jgi:hypothetical protein
MATLRWDRVHWDDFLAVLEAYNKNFTTKPNQDPAYRRCLRQLDGRSIAERAAKARDIVLFLNNWGCMVNRTDSPSMLGQWIRDHADALEKLSTTHLLDDGLVDAIEEMNALYEDLLAEGKRVVPNWGPAATAKSLHQVIPALFMMWDTNILPFADNYADFTLEMHRLGQRLADEVRVAPLELDAHLQRHLGIAVRKTVAKYLDEYNWYVMVGAAQAAG